MTTTVIIKCVLSTGRIISNKQRSKFSFHFLFFCLLNQSNKTLGHTPQISVCWMILYFKRKSFQMYLMLRVHHCLWQCTLIMGNNNIFYWFYPSYGQLNFIDSINFFIYVPNQLIAILIWYPIWFYQELLAIWMKIMYSQNLQPTLYLYKKAVFTKVSSKNDTPAEKLYHLFFGNAGNGCIVN